MPITKTVRYKLYTFKELSDAAKDKARDWYREGALDYDWWEFIYQDAESVGLKITGFDLDRRRSATGHLTLSVSESIKAILANHGKDCETYKIALEYQASLNEARVRARLEAATSEDGDDCEECIDDTVEAVEEDLKDDYEKELLEEYSLMLQRECDYLLSDEAVDESITCNDYTFTKNGERKD
jgi:hypothetical protein